MKPSAAWPRSGFKGRSEAMDGNIFNSQGMHVPLVRGTSIFDLSGKKLYHLRGVNIHRTSGELVGHLSSLGSERRLDKSPDKLFSNTR
jgi:hypothetical protein